MTIRTCPTCESDVETPGTTCPVCGSDLPDTPDPEPTDDLGGDAADGAPEPATENQEEPVQRVTDAPSDAPSGAAAPPPPPPVYGTAPVPAAPGRYRQPTQDPTHPSGLASWVRTWGLLTHLSAFVGAFFAVAFVGPLVMWLIRREEHPFLDHHGKEALNFNLSMLLYTVVGVVLSIATLGIGLIVTIPLGIALFFTWLIAPIVAAVKASNGEGFRYPVTIRFIAD